MLTLPIKKKWFDMIDAGEKTEEYWDIKPCWRVRFHKAGLCLANGIGTWEREILLVNGYGADRPAIRATVRLSIGQGRSEWGAVPGKLYYRLIILKKERIR